MMVNGAPTSCTTAAEICIRFPLLFGGVGPLRFPRGRDNPVSGATALDPCAASVTDRMHRTRHHIGRFFTPQQRYLAPTLLAAPDRLFIVG